MGGNTSKGDAKKEATARTAVLETPPCFKAKLPSASIRACARLSSPSISINPWLCWACLGGYWRLQATRDGVADVL